MKTAVIYYSREGNTRYVAGEIAEALGADVIEIKPKKAYPTEGFKKFFHGGKDATMKKNPELEPYSFNADDYEMVILCTPVWAGTFTPPMRSFLSSNDLSRKKVAALVCCSGGNTEKCFAQLKEAAGVERFEAQVRLVDPKSKPSEENERLLTEFIGKLADA